ncbi:peptidase U32 [Treponema sp. R8-4-B8]
MELLAPAGSPEALDAAIGEGADAVYLGLKDFNARLRSANFTYAQFETALRSLHKMGKKVYVTVNTVFEQREADRMYQFLKYLANQGPDALIVQDFGVVAMARAEFPSLRLHASTQMNIASARGANALSRHGVSRVVLARELSLEEIKSVKSETNLELEVFVHGALCISVSGLCLFSSFLGGKSANRGMCTQACRRLYHRAGAESGGENGYYFSPNDLQLLESVPLLAAAGVSALKIEGRMKSASYVGTVVSAYRLVLDACIQDACAHGTIANSAVINDASVNDVSAYGTEDAIQRSIERGQEILRNDFARPKTRYFFEGRAKTAAQDGKIANNGASENTETKGINWLNLTKDGEITNNSTSENDNGIDWLNPAQDGGTGISLGTILKVKGTGDERRALVCPPRGIAVSVRDSVRIHHSDDSGRVSHKLTFAQEDGGHSGYWISAPEGDIGDHVYLIQIKEMAKRYAPIITKVSGGKGPGREKAPFPQIQVRQLKNRDKHSKNAETFPEGLYIAVSRPEDFYVVQSSRPQRVMLTLSAKNANYLLDDNKPPLPFKPAEIILTLDPWFPQEIASYENEKMAEEINLLTEKGYYQYVLNNPGHFSLFRDYENIKLIAGPWLYMFNSWALSFVSSLGADGFVSPLENNRQNLERALGIESRNGGKKEGKKRQSRGALHSKFFITVFAWPPLFNIKANLSPVLDFDLFADNMDEEFLLETSPEGSRVYPKKYFSIIDKIPFLKEAGFGRFIIDLSGHALKKSNYRDLIRSVNENAPLPNSSRFNWKDGFFVSKP